MTSHDREKNSASLKLTRRALFGAVAVPLLGAQERPRIKKLGTIDLDLVEVTPIVWKGRLYRSEWVRSGYWANKEHKDYARFVERATGRATPAFAHGHQFASAFVDGDTAYVTAVEKGGQPMLRMFASRERKESAFLKTLTSCGGSPLGGPVTVSVKQRTHARAMKPVDLLASS